MFFPAPTRISGLHGGKTPPAANSFLIATNVLLFVCGFNWQWGVGSGRSIFTALTYAFVHADVLHLLGNMWILWLFGNAVNRRVGASCI